MSEYHLYILYGRILSRSQARGGWAEADRIEALVLQAGIVDALREIRWLVDVDETEEAYGQTRWLLWLKDVNDTVDLVAGTPLGHLGLWKPGQLFTEDAPETREWLARLRKERGSRPAPPKDGNILEQLLEHIPLGLVRQHLDDPAVGEAERVLICWAMYCSLDRAMDDCGDNEAVRQSLKSRRDDLHPTLLSTIRAIHHCHEIGGRWGWIVKEEW